MRRKRVTASDVAKQAGVSQTTVSIVLSGRDGNSIPETTRGRVREAAALLGYRPHGLARALARGRTDVFAILLFDEAPFGNADSYFLRTVLHLLLVAVLRSGRSPMLFASTAESPLDPHTLTDGRADAFLLVSPVPDEPLVHFLSEQRLPFVALEARGEFPSGSWVDVDNESGVAAAVEHLAAAGHRRIAHLSGPEGNRNADRRRIAFLKEMEARGLPVPPDFIRFGQFVSGLGEEAALSLLSLPPGRRPSAIFAGNDNMAVGAYHAARRLELRIPRDLSLVSFDDTEFAQVLDPPLTTVRQPLTEMAEAAVDLLVNCCTSAEQRSPSPRVLSANLVRRGSVAPPLSQEEGFSS